ncbi:MAG: NAD-dependent DNA ligase LigA [Butyrivibrio sp.]|uniref:NAD-dependent DNA ligase LigA n=1 Tax=Butyrivibrio sp. TaxID=28121 RepID=UPI001B562F24|nr:NAD-dependent DNA ligase LigA [Butyrivibrio sp.]MBP3783847.1 NAD-dependent DNA ligase LigA [Butyrivibrio sp.]
MITKTFVADGSAQAVLTQELAEANEAYRNSGITLMSDLEYDKKLEELATLEEKNGFKYDISPTDKVGAEVVSELKKVTHEAPALSLDKVKYKDREDLVMWLKNSDDHDNAVISWKNDGLTVVATYDNGKLTQAVTRGDGVVGSDITHNARFFKGLPLEIPFKDHLVVRGEAVMTFAEFEKVNAENDGIYENPRNLASATIQMLDANESKKREIRFIAFELVEPGTDVLIGNIDFNLQYQIERFGWLYSLGFNVVENEKVNSTNILNRIEVWKAALSELDYPTDGLVISFDDMEYGMSLGNTGHHFRHSMALKWSDETVETTIRDIEWSVGKTGVITPVAIFDEVRLGLGSNVTRASLHNLSIMRKLGVKIGSKAQVYLANMIIPQIAETDGQGEDIHYPGTCPICGETTYVSEDNGVRTLHCENRNCAARQIGSLMNTFSKDGLFVKGLGESQIVDLMGAGLVDSTPLSFYRLVNKDKDSICQNDITFLAMEDGLLSLDGWGKKKWDNLMDAIDASRGTTLQKFLYSLNIPLLGNDLSKKLSKYWKDDINAFKAFVESFTGLYEGDYSRDDEAYAEGVYEAEYRKLCEIDGVGAEKAKNIINWVEETTAYREKYEDFIALINELNFPEPKAESSDNSLEGLTFVITGSVHDYKNRDEFKVSVEARGGKVAGSVSAKTSFLVNNDITSTSGKNAKAKELNIPIISEDEFISRFGR